MSENSAESSLAWTAIVVLIAGCVTGSTITAIVRDRANAHHPPNPRRVVFQLTPRRSAANRAVPGKRQPIPGDGAADPSDTAETPRRPVPPLDLFLPQPLPQPIAPAPLVAQRHQPAQAPSTPATPIAENVERHADTPPQLNAPDNASKTVASAPSQLGHSSEPQQGSPTTTNGSTTNDASHPRIAETTPPAVGRPFAAAPSQQTPVSAPDPLRGSDAEETEFHAQQTPARPALPTPSGIDRRVVPTLTSAQQEAARRAIERVEPRVESLVAAGMEAGRRNASFTARDKMIDALRLLAQVADVATGVEARTLQLNRGLIAVEESAEFARNAEVFDTTLSPSRIVAKHRSQIVNSDEAVGMSHLDMQRRYLEFAQQSLSAAAADSPAGSLALVGIAKFYLIRAGTDGMKREGPRAVALCQAALVVDPSNFSAANELGALLAQYGRLNDAKQMLLTSLRSKPTVAAWHNLAVVHDRLGEADLANLARQELASLQEKEGLGSRQVGWVDKTEFAKTHPGPGGSGRTAFNTIAAPAQAAPPTQPQTTANRRWFR